MLVDFLSKCRVFITTRCTVTPGPKKGVSAIATPDYATPKMEKAGAWCSGS